VTQVVSGVTDTSQQFSVKFIAAVSNALQSTGVSNIIIISMVAANGNVQVHYTVSTANRAISSTVVQAALSSSDNLDTMTTFLKYYYNSVSGVSVPVVVNLSPTATPTAMPSFRVGAPTPLPTLATTAIVQATYVSKHYFFLSISTTFHTVILTLAIR
jgi:hypothetical protein